MTTVIEDYLLPDGTPDSGTVTFKLSETAYQPLAGIHRTEGDIICTLNGSGSISVNLQPTSGGSSDWAVPGVHYIVTEKLGRGASSVKTTRVYRVDVPSSGPARLGELDHL